MRAHYHHGQGWVAGTLALIPRAAPEEGTKLKPGRITFKADKPAELMQDATIRTTGRIEEPCRRALHAPPSMVRSYRPPQGSKLLFLKIGRTPRDRNAAFAVEDAEAVLAAFPQPGE